MICNIKVILLTGDVRYIPEYEKGKIQKKKKKSDRR